MGATPTCQPCHMGPPPHANPVTWGPPAHADPVTRGHPHMPTCHVRPPPHADPVTWGTPPHANLSRGATPSGPLTGHDAARLPRHHPAAAPPLRPPADPAMMIPTITPKSPSALPKISTTRIFTNSEEFCASDSAQLLPTMPTHMLRAGHKFSVAARVRSRTSTRASDTTARGPVTLQHEGQ